jgi:hemolysin activation/secretion protein
VSGSALAQDAGPQVAAPQQDSRFDVWEYRVLGNSVLAPREIEATVYGHLGPQKTLADVETVREALEGLYRDRGYGTVFVDIPEQDVVDGLVRLRVTEGRLDEVRVTGPRYFSAGQIRSALPSLATGAVVNLEQLQDELTWVNRQSADRQVTPVLKAGGAPGTVQVDLRVKDSPPFHASIEVNDRYTADTSRTRAGVNLSYDNLFQKFHRLSLQYQTAPEEPEESRVIAATYVAPLDSGDMLAAYVVDTSSDFATLSGLGGLAILGTGRIYGVRYINLLPATERRSSSLTFGADYKDFEDSIAQPDGLTDVTPMRYVNWSAVYAATLRGETTLTSQALGVNIGIRGAGNGSEEFEYKRYKAKPNYFYLRGEASHDRPFVRDSRLFLRLVGQLTLEPLISNEQFSIGGVESVRGYLEAEQLGDNGLFANVEVRSPPLSKLWPEHLGASYAFGFVDAGVVGILEPLPVDGVKTSHYSLSSAGIGLRVNGLSGLQAALEWAYPFEATDTVDSGDARLHFQVLYGF